MFEINGTANKDLNAKSLECLLHVCGAHIQIQTKGINTAFEKTPDLVITVLINNALSRRWSALLYIWQ